MATIDISGLTLNPQEETEFGKFVYQLLEQRPDLRLVHDLVTGIKTDQFIVLVSNLGKTGLKATASCDRKFSGAGVVLSEKKWQLAGIEDTLDICQATISQLFKAYYNKIQYYRENYEVEGSDELLMMLGMLEKSIIETIWRATWFGDTTVAEADADSAGVTVADNVDFYNYFNGLWKQIFAGVTAGTVLKVAISENAETTLADQINLASGRSVELLNAVYDLAPSKLRSQEDAQFLVTGAIFGNYRKYLQGKGENFTIDYTVKGMESLMFNGKKIVNMETVWSQGTIEDFVDNTTNNAGYLPNRIVFTLPVNIPIGTLSEEDFATIESWYERKERKQYLGYGIKLDSKLIEEELIVVAY